MSGNEKNVLIFADHTRPGIKGALEQVSAKLAGRVKTVNVDLGTVDLGKIAETTGELGIVLGGDGTILSVARAHGDHQRPLLGINLGKLGYLAAFGMADLDFIADQITHETLVVSQRLMLRGRLEQDGQIPFDSYAINDMVIQAGPPFRMIELAISVNDDRVTSVSGDGLIVATPTGSTGHNIGAGGPVVDFSTSAIVVTPICAHSLTHQPLVLSSGSRITVQAKRINRGSALIIDGQVCRGLSEDATLRIFAADSKFLLVHNQQYNRWHTLQAKLNWGVGPNYET